MCARTCNSPPLPHWPTGWMRSINRKKSPHDPARWPHP
jgi:hypothetical protein